MLLDNRGREEAEDFAERIVENIDSEQYMCYWVLKDTSVDTEETGGACTSLVS
jgi:hypothetical protein